MEEQEKTIIKKRKEKKQVTTKKLVRNRIIFIIIYAAAIIGTTVYLFLNQKNTNEEIDKNKAAVDEVQEKEQEKAKHKGLIDIENDTYNINDLNILEKEEEYRGNKIFYYQIDGLLDKDIQSSINYDLKKDYEKLIDEFLDNYDVSGYELSFHNSLSSSFANTLSISYSGNMYKNEENWDYRNNITKHACENFDLTTGNRISLYDLFTDDVKANIIFDSNFYDQMVCSQADVTYNEDTWNLEISDYNDIEDKIFELSYRFNKKDLDIPFTFDAQKIELYDYYAHIYYEDFPDYVAIYNRYKTEKSIFNGKYIRLHNLPVFVKRYDSDFQVIEKGDNYYIDFSLFDVYNPTHRQENYDMIRQSLIDRIKDEINQLKQEANNSSEFLVVNGYYDIYANGEYIIETGEYILDGTYELRCDIAKYRTTKSYFESKVYPKIIEVERYSPRTETGEAYMWNNQFMWYIRSGLDIPDDAIESNYYNLYIDRAGNILDTPIWKIND